jgi:pimeloyl-ACP methyl ester carboxylesterase
MHVEVNGTRLWFDVDGPALAPEGPEMRERPTVVLLHGGPGSFDPSYFKPDFARLTQGLSDAGLRGRAGPHHPGGRCPRVRRRAAR